MNIIEVQTNLPYISPSLSAEVKLLVASKHGVHLLDVFVIAAIMLMLLFSKAIKDYF
jgi:hypothetical protein